MGGPLSRSQLAIAVALADDSSQTASSNSGSSISIQAVGSNTLDREGSADFHCSTNTRGHFDSSHFCLRSSRPFVPKTFCFWRFKLATPAVMVKPAAAGASARRRRALKVRPSQAPRQIAMPAQPLSLRPRPPRRRRFETDSSDRSLPRGRPEPAAGAPQGQDVYRGWHRLVAPAAGRAASRRQ